MISERNEHSPLTVEYINNLSYTAFIGLINQTNVPPGSFSTLTHWRLNSGITQASTIFEVACTTGFSLLNLVQATNCKGTGVDISLSSIERAKKNAIQMNLLDKTQFFCEDATVFKSKEKFSHVILGAALGFFPNPTLMINNIFSLVENQAYLLASPFYSIKEVPKEVIEESKRILNIIPTIHGYKEIMKVYKGFDIFYENRLSSIPETEEEIKHYCDSTITRCCQDLFISDNELYDLLFKRLYQIKQISNKLRDYQNYSILVLRYNKNTFPNRFVELF